jgi:hypothetical protein
MTADSFTRFRGHDMKQTLQIAGIALAAQLLASCASQFALIAPQTCAEATALKNICATIPCDASERTSADSLYNQGAVLIRTGGNEQAYLLLSSAIIRYRLILERQAIVNKERTIETLKRGLAEDMQELSACQRSINELSRTKQP